VLPSGFEAKMLSLPLRDMERFEWTSLAVWLCIPTPKIKVLAVPLRESLSLSELMSLAVRFCHQASK